MKIDFETIIVFVSFITSFFAVFLSNGIIIGVPAIAQDFAMNNVRNNHRCSGYCPGLCNE